MSKAVLGIDGGGTRTRATIVNGEQILAFAENGSIKRLRVGARVAEENLRSLMAEVYAQAGVTRWGSFSRRCQFQDAGCPGMDHSGLCATSVWSDWK